MQQPFQLNSLFEHLHNNLEFLVKAQIGAYQGCQNWHVDNNIRLFSAARMAHWRCEKYGFNGSVELNNPVQSLQKATSILRIKRRYKAIEKI